MERRPVRLKSGGQRGLSLLSMVESYSGLALHFPASVVKILIFKVHSYNN